MSLFIASLNSGSNGNCYYVGNEHEAVLVDAGISCRETEKRMLRLGLSMKKVRAIFVSHEHSDHINGIPVLSKKYQLPVYITPPTMRGGSLVIDGELLNSFTPFETVTIGGLNITPFPKKHDASDPYSFTITSAGVTVGVFTDIGIACENLVSHFSRCHAAFLEANYDDDMLDKGGYPYHLKRRIRGGNGHLSNKQAVELFIAHRPAFMSHLLLAHLSKNNNDPQLVQELFEACAGGVNIIVASRYQETEVYYINGNHNPELAGNKGAIDLKPVQTSLF
ncbi:MBL fold metallo-hydrolase [uncultured Mucilaginibacter sp.]|uniref:MBL fold metallo-hydrolase n=1 Tax=uncultured Mucilaginibacter sp. TaxID=797541 RepID=UPI002600E5CE|nr:MBL fold metallo-hydrolase [uncultured Mucilaginibacter sp.]